MSIKIINISKKFASFQALNGISLEIRTGELVALLGPSGSGKTTLLRVIAGLESPDEGSILIHNKETNGGRIGERNVGFVFQHYALFKHMPIFDNVAFGLRARPKSSRPSKKAIETRVHDLLKLVQLDGFSDRFPRQLSGGQRQRVALARALAVEPSVLLLDEPFGALDARVRAELRRWIRTLHDELHVTSVFVTHDQEEALEVADKVVVMNSGKIEQVGDPDEVYENPASPFVYDFLGAVNIFHGRISGGMAHIGNIKFASPEHSEVDGSPAIGYVRSHDIDIEKHPTEKESLPLTVHRIHKVGNTVRVELVPLNNGGTIEVHITKDALLELDLKSGEKVYIRPRKVKVFVDDYQI